MKGLQCNLLQISDASYAGFPAVRRWNEREASPHEWSLIVRRAYRQGNGISLYIHLPFCESLCPFCSFNPFITRNHEIESQYIDHLLAEWKMYVQLLGQQPEISEIYLGGGTPSFFSPQQIRRLIEGIRTTSKMRKAPVLHFEAQLMQTSLEHLIELYALGFRHLTIGVQDADPAVQKVIGRIQPESRLTEFVRNARYIGFSSIGFNLLYGLPAQTRKSVIRTMYLVRDLRPDRVMLREYRHAPETNPAQQQFDSLLPVDPEKFAQLAIAREMLATLGYNDLGLDHFAVPSDRLCVAQRDSQLHLNLMGYTPVRSSLVIGLGAGAVSDALFAFVQNERSLPAYYAAIRKKQFPVGSGKFLTKSEVIVRRHILRLQCNGETEWKDPSDQHPLWSKSLAAIGTFLRSKLVTLSGHYLRINPRGKILLRDICTALQSQIMTASFGSEIPVQPGVLRVQPSTRRK